MSNHRRGNRASELGVLLLLNYIFNSGGGVMPPVTLGAVILQIAIYVGYFILPYSVPGACISGLNVLFKKKYSLLVSSALEHADDMHLYYNMTSFTIKGRYLEKKYGSVNFFLLLIVMIYATSGFYLLNSYILYKYYNEDYSQLIQCAVGFSGVVFALKTIITREKPSETYNILGMSIPAWGAAWAELIAISLMVSNASFRGHLAGIFAGLIYTDTPIGSIIDFIISTISGKKVYHNFKRPSFSIFGERRQQYSYNGGGGDSSYSGSRYQSGYSTTGGERYDFRSRRQPPAYGFVFGNNNQDNNNWEYDFYDR